MSGMDGDVGPLTGFEFRVQHGCSNKPGLNGNTLQILQK